MNQIRNFMEGDELVKLDQEKLTFGKILQKHLASESFQVRWKNADGVLEHPEVFNPLDDEGLVRVVDRKHSEGGLVIHHESGRVGTILEEQVLGTLLLHESHCVINNVPLNDLQTFKYVIGELVCYKGWLGEVSSLDYAVTMCFDKRLANLTMAQCLRTQNSLGFESYEKNTPPYPNAKMTPTPKEYGTISWPGISFMDSAANFVLTYQGAEGVILKADINRFSVNWIGPLDKNSDAPQPPRVVPYDEIIDFDIMSKYSSKLHSLTKYKVREEDKAMDLEEAEDMIVQELVRRQNGPVQKRQKRSSNPMFCGCKSPPVGSVHVVELLRLNHHYLIKYENCELTRVEPGHDLSPYSKFVKPVLRLESLEYLFSYERKFVATKLSVETADGHPITNESVFGLTQNRDLKEDWIYLDVYELIDGGEYRFMGQTEKVSRFEVYPHPQFGGLKRGAIVTRRDNPELPGMVIRVTSNAMVQVNFGRNTNILVHPQDLILINLTLPKYDDDDYDCIRDQSINQHVHFLEMVASNLEQFLSARTTDGVYIKPKVPGNCTQYSVMMIGPKATPYEDGVFTFDLELDPKCYGDRLGVNLRVASPPEQRELLSCNLFMDSPPGFKDWAPEEGEEGGDWGYQHTISLMDLFEQIREDMFPSEPVFSRPKHRSRANKLVIEASESKLYAEVVGVNSGVVISVIDLLLKMKANPPELWRSEIEEHFKQVAPRFIKRLDCWTMSALDFHGDLEAQPGFHLYPISSGFESSLKIRRKTFAKFCDDEDAKTENVEEPTEEEDEQNFVE